MKALSFSSHGDVSKLEYNDFPEPEPGPGEVLLRVRAAALNHLDLWVLRGWPGLKLELPHIGGSDIAGEVVSTGFGVEGWKRGARAVLTPGFLPAGYSDEYTVRGEESMSPRFEIFGESRRGGFAELIAAPAHTLHPIPDHLGFSEAAAPLLVATTAWRMLKQRAKLQKGETVLIVGSGGGVNSFSILLAKDIGAKVIALSGSAEKMRKAESLGADVVLNYRENREWSTEIRRLTDKRGADVVVDNVGASTFMQTLLAAARGGRIVTVGNTSGYNITFDNRLVFAKQLSILGSTMGSAQDFREAAAYAWAKPLKPLIARELPLKDGREAYEMMEKGNHFGKIVLLP